MAAICTEQLSALNMDDYISIALLNDFIFCPYSIYLHNVYMEEDETLYKATPQIRGTIAHEGIEDGEYIEKLLGNKSLSIEVCKLKNADGTMIELIKSSKEDYQDSHSVNVTSAGCLHIAFTVSDLEKLYKRLKSDGISFISEPLLSPDGNVHVCFCRDPEGNYLELVQELR